MLKYGARRRVRNALEPHLSADEQVEVSGLGYVRGRGDYAVGLTQDRLIWVRVGKLTGQPTGEANAERLSALRVDQDWGRVGILSVGRQSGEQWRFAFDRMWWSQLDQIIQGVVRPAL